MAKDRVIYQSEALFVSSGVNSTEPYSHNNINRVQSANYGFSIPKEYVNQYGQLGPVGTVTIESPTVDFSTSYYLTNGCNESFFQIPINGQTPFGENFFKTNSGQNIYILTSENGKDFKKSAGEDGPISAISIGNVYLSDYSVSFGVGELPRVDVNFQGSNISSEVLNGPDSITSFSLGDNIPEVFKHTYNKTGSTYDAYSYSFNKVSNKWYLSNSDTSENYFGQSGTSDFLYPWAVENWTGSSGELVELNFSKFKGGRAVNYNFNVENAAIDLATDTKNTNLVELPSGVNNDADVSAITPSNVKVKIKNTAKTLQSKVSNIADLAFWVDASDSSTVLTAESTTPQGGNRVIGFIDKVNGETGTVNVSNDNIGYLLNEKNGLNVLYASGGDPSAITFPNFNTNTGEFEAFVLVNIQDTESQNVGFFGDADHQDGGFMFTHASDDRSRLILNNGDLVYGNNDGLQLALYATNVYLDEYLLLNASYNSNESSQNTTFRINKDEEIKNGTLNGGLGGAPNNFTIFDGPQGGWSNDFVGYFAEGLVFDRKLTNEERTLVTYYLQEKWGHEVGEEYEDDIATFSTTDDASLIQTASINVPFNLGGLQRIGNNIFYARVPQPPIGVDFSMSAVVTEMNSDNLSDVMNLSDFYNIEISCDDFDGNEICKYKLANASLTSESFNSAIGSNKIVDFIFEGQLGSNTNFSDNLFFSGSYVDPLTPFNTTYDGAAATYSLRDLNNKNGETTVVRVRRDSDNNEKDFTAKELENGTMLDWVQAQTVLPLDIGEPDGDNIRLSVPNGGTAIETPHCAYSLRNLSENYTGYVVEVRRGTDGTIKNFTAEELTGIESWANESMVDTPPLDVAGNAAAAAYSLRSLGSNQWTYGGDTLEYESDFSVGGQYSSFAPTSEGTLTTDEEIGGEVDCLKATANGASIFTAVHKTMFTVGEEYFVSADVYIPSSNNEINGVQLSVDNTDFKTNENPTLDTWFTISGSAIAHHPYFKLRGLADGNAVGHNSNTTDVFYVRNVKVYESIGDTEYLPSGKYVVQVRRSSDDAVKSFTASEVADGTLESFCGTEDITSSLNLLSVVGEVNSVTDRSNFTITYLENSSAEFTVLKNNSTLGAGTYKLTGTIVATDLSHDVRFRSAGGGSTYQSSPFTNGTNVIDETFTLTGNPNNLTIYAVANAAGSLVVSNLKLEQISCDGHVKTWYDQSNNNNHSAQTDPTHQPKIIEGGSQISGIKFISSSSESRLEYLDVPVSPSDLTNDGADPYMSMLFVGSGISHYGQLVGNNSNVISYKPGSWGMYYASNNLSWKNEQKNKNPGLVESLNFDSSPSYGDKFLAFASVGHIHQSFPATSNNASYTGVLTSLNGVTTTGEFVGETGQYNGVDYTGDVLFTTTNMRIMASSYGTDNVDWIRSPSGVVNEVIIFSGHNEERRKSFEENISNHYDLNIEINKDAYVKTWYDQAGSNDQNHITNNAVQDRSFNQPKIVNSGVYLNEIKFNEDVPKEPMGDWFRMDENWKVSDYQSFSFFGVVEAGSSASNDPIIGVNNSSRSIGFSAATSFVYAHGQYYATFPDGPKTGKHIYSIPYVSGRINPTYRDGVASDTTDQDSSDGLVGHFDIIGSRRIYRGNQAESPTQNPSEFYNNSMQEIILYTGDQSGNREFIEANMGEAYGIDNLVSDNSMLANETNGYVSIWYNQIENGPDATQTAMINQPMIVDGSKQIGAKYLNHINFDGYHSIYFANDDNQFFIFDQVLTSINNSYAAVVYENKEKDEPTDSNGYVLIASRAIGPPKPRFYIYENGSFYFGDNTAPPDAFSANVGVGYDEFVLLSANISEGHVNVFKNSTFFDDHQLTGSYGGTDGRIGSNGVDNGGAKINVKEVVIYNSDKTNDRENIEKNIAKSYNITLS